MLALTIAFVIGVIAGGSSIWLAESAHTSALADELEEACAKRYAAEFEIEYLRQKIRQVQTDHANLRAAL